MTTVLYITFNILAALLFFGLGLAAIIGEFHIHRVDPERSGGSLIVQALLLIGCGMMVFCVALGAIFEAMR